MSAGAGGGGRGGGGDEGGGGEGGSGGNGGGGAGDGRMGGGGGSGGGGSGEGMGGINGGGGGGGLPGDGGGGGGGGLGFGGGQTYIAQIRRLQLRWIEQRPTVLPEPHTRQLHLSGSIPFSSHQPPHSDSDASHALLAKSNISSVRRRIGSLERSIPWNRSGSFASIARCAVRDVIPDDRGVPTAGRARKCSRARERAPFFFPARRPPRGRSPLFPT